jgi:hypothetical protein
MLNSIEDLARVKAREIQAAGLQKKVPSLQLLHLGKLRGKISIRMAGVGSWLKTWKIVTGPNNYVPTVDLDGLEKVL